MKPLKNKFHFDFPVSLQEEFAGVVARVDGLPPTLRYGDLRRGRMGGVHAAGGGVV